MRRNVVANINRLLSKSTAELRNISHRNVIQSPQHILVKRRMILLQTYLDVICK